MVVQYAKTLAFMLESPDFLSELYSLLMRNGFFLVQ